jgi:hypothetical protein
MEEIVPGVHAWHAHHDGIGMTVHSFYVAPARALIDPMLPLGGVDAIAALPLAHGGPMATGGRQALAEFATAP